MKQSYAHATMLLTARFALLLLLVMVIVMEADARPVPPSPSTLSSLSRWGVVGGPADSVPSIPILAAAETSMDVGGRWGKHQAKDDLETCTQERCGGGSGALRGKREELAFSYSKSGGGTEEAWNLAEEEAWGRERYYGARGIENHDLEARKGALYNGEYLVEKCAYGDSRCFVKNEH